MYNFEIGFCNLAINKISTTIRYIIYRCFFSFAGTNKKCLLMLQEERISKQKYFTKNTALK